MWWRTAGRPPVQDSSVLRTSCGRRLAVGRVLGAGPRTMRRVTLRISAAPDSPGAAEVWAALTAREARSLAGYLLAHADALDDATRR